VRRFPDGTPFFHEKAYLTVSGQLHGEALAYGLGRIYTLGPTFRAENSNTARHAAEFWMVEPEAAFFTAEDNQKLAIAYLKHGINDVLTHAEEDVHMLGKLHDPQLLKRLENLVEQSFVTISYTQAVDILRKEHPDSQALVWGEDLSTPQERFLTEEIYKKPVVVIDYPKSLKPFYMYQNEDGKTVGAMDILVPKIGEIIGGSQREHRLERLSASMQAMELDEAHYGWYIEMNRFGGVPHAGFGLGLERWVMLCTGISNIRDVIPFPRTPGHIQL
jgi:asparaginyl-tRNA synthetase